MNRITIKSGFVPICFLTAFMASGQLKAGAAYATAYQSESYAVGVGVTDSAYAMGGAHTAYTTVTIRSPSGRSATGGSSEANIATSYAYLDLLTEDGPYTATNVAMEYCPYAGYFSDGEVEQTTTIRPFVQLVNTSITDSPMGKVEGHAPFTVTVAMSSACVGSVVVNAVITYPNGMGIHLRANPPDGDGIYHGDTASALRTLAGGQSWNFGYTIETTINNTQAGDSTATGYILTYPAACQPLGPTPSSGNTAARNFTVNP